MPLLRDVANSIRATNNGATRRSFDIMFDDVGDFERVWGSGAITPDLISRLYTVPVGDVQIFGFAPANAIKIVIPRKIVAGSPDDTDIDGKQQHAPLLDIEIPGN
jgi:Domain of unknown function (DUF4387)